MGLTFDDVATPSRGAARRAVLLALRDGGPASRAQLARAAGLAPATLTATARRLLDDGLVLEAGPASAAGARSGPRGTRLALDPDLAAVLGIEVGFRTVRVVVCDVSGAVRATAQERLGTDHTAAEGLPVVARAAAAALQAAGVLPGRVTGAAVALRGPVDAVRQCVPPSGELSGWAGLAAGDVAVLLGVPVHLDNDANLAALGEHVLGAGRGTSTSLTVKAHSGIGAGIVVGGELVTGLHGGAGEIGHTPVDPRGPLCRCGKRGCLDTVAAVPALLAAAAPRSGPLTLSELLRRLEDGDAGARRLLEDAAAAIGDVVADACLLLAPERVVLVGALSRAGEALRAPVERAVVREALPHAGPPPQVVLGELGERATPLGAAALALRRSGWLPAGRGPLPVGWRSTTQDAPGPPPAPPRAVRSVRSGT